MKRIHLLAVLANNEDKNKFYVALCALVLSFGNLTFRCEIVVAKDTNETRQDKAAIGVWLHGRLYCLIHVSAEGDFHAVIARYTNAHWSATCIFGVGRGAWLAA